MKLKQFIFAFMAMLLCFSVSVNAQNVAKVGNTEYATIDEAIGAWSNNSTLTLLADVTLSDVVTLKSTEHHILDLSTYTMTAASGKNAFVIKACGTGSAERTAITINADATNPGGINAGSNCVVYYKYADGGISTEDRPIIKINGGVFTGSTSSWGTAGIYTIGTAARKCATLNITGGTFNCSINGSGKSKLIVSGGVFNYSVGSQGDSTALRLISGGTFKTFGFMTADSNNTKFWFGTSMGNSNVGVYVDDEGYIVVGGPVNTEAGDKFKASSENYSGASSLLQYSSAATNGLYYTSVKEALADNNKSTGSVTVYVDELDMAGISYKGTIVVPEGNDITITNAPSTLKVQLADGTVLTPNANGTVATKLEVATLAELQAALASTTNVPIIITKQIEIPAGETVELNLNGKTVNSVFNGNSTTNHIYALSNKGTLTIEDSKGNGSINSRGIYNYGSLTLNAGAINAIDGNGGYAVNNQSGSTFVMNGGVVAATNEDDHQSSSGGYDATALKVPADCTATLNGGTINNVCDFTYAIDAAGTLNIPETSTITVNGTHGAIAVSGGVTTIDAGTFQIPADNYSRTDNVLYVSGGSLVVNGGTFIGDSDTAAGGSCLYDAAGTAVVNGGTFKGSSGGDVWGTTGTNIKGGTFENLTEKQHIADGYELGADGTVKAKPVAAVIGTQKYATLAAALAAAQAGDEITLVSDVTEDVTTTKKVTIDGAGKTYTGAMTLKADATISNLNFDGKGFNGYAITTRGANYLTIEDCTAKNYGYGFVQLASATALTTVKNVNVSEMNYGVKVDYSGAVVLENVDITAGTAAVLNSNYGEKTITVKNSKLNILGTWKRNDTTKTTYVFEGANTVDKFITEDALDNFKLAAGATLTAPEGKTVTTDVENSVVVYKDGAYKVIPAAAKIATTSYATLEEAFKAVKTGETVTIFEGTYKVPAMKAGITVVGEGEVLLEGTLSGTLENLTLKNLHIKGGNAQRWAYGKGDLVFENVTFEATSVYALHFDGITAGTNLTYKNCTIIGWAAMGGSPASCVFDGCTIKGNGTYGVIRTYFDTTIKGCTFDVANVSTTDAYEDGIHAVEGAKVVVNECTNANGDMKDIVNVHGASVVTIDGVEIKNAAKAGNKYYATFEEAFAAVQAGETLTLLADLNLKEILTINKAITFDGNGKTLTSTAGRAINVSGAEANGVKILNLTINASGERAINVIQNATNVTIENVTATAANYTVNVATSAPKAVVAISGSNLTGLNVVNVAAPQANVTINGGTITCNDQNEAENYAALALNKDAVGAKIAATGVTFDIKGDSKKAKNGAEGGVITIDGNTDDVDVVVAYIDNGGNYYYGYPSLKAAIAKAKEGETITLLRDLTMDYNARDAYETQAQNVVIDGKGKTLTLNQKNSDWASIGLANNSKLVLKNMTIEKTGYGDTSGAWNTHAIIFSCPVEMSNVTVNNSIAVQAGATLNNVTINEANAYYGLWINGNGQEVTIKGGAIKATNGGRGIKIADEYIDNPAQVTLSVDGTVFTTAKKAAVLVSSKAGANITASNVNIENVAEDKVNFVWVDEDWAQYFDQVEVTGATVSPEGGEGSFAAAITANGAVQAYYKTLAEAIAASTPETGWGGEVTLLKDVTLEGGYADASEGLRIEKSVTINGAGHTIDCGKFTKGIRIYQNADQASNVMFKNINIVNNNAQGRCIDTRSGKINLMLNGGVNLTAHGTNSQPLTIGGSEAMTKVTISGGTIDAGTSGYAVICFVPVTNHINVQGNAVIKGLAAFYLKEGVTETAIKLFQSTSIGTNKYAAASGVFGAVVIEGSNNTVRLEHDQAIVKAVAGDGAEMATQAAFLVRGEGNTINILAENAQVITEGKNAYRAIVNTDVAASTKMIEADNELKLVAENRGYQFYSFEEAVRFAGNEGTIKVVNDFELAEVWTVAAGQNITLDLNGKTLSTAFADGSTTNHLYAIHNYGELTITDSSDAKNGKISTRGNFNYGTLTLEAGTINAIDGNGGYGVRNYAGATFTMNGGTIATTLEDDNKVDKGGYDASPVRVDEGATFTMNGGVINNICDFTVAIDNYGTTIINDGKATTVHTTLANSGTMTINGGEFTCNGIEGITAHALWAAAGETTINGGTFDGKDNYNGFNVDASKGANVVIKGGNFLSVHSGSLYGDGTITVSGGTFFDKIPEERCELGFQAVVNTEGTYDVIRTDKREAYTIEDGKFTEFVNEKEITVGTLTYTRTFGSKYQGVWMALYVPFEIPVSKLTDMGYEVAYFNDFRETLNADGEIIEGKSVIEMVKIKRGTLKANYPYAIKAPKMNPEVPVTLELVLNDVKLYSTTGERETVECSSATKRFTFSGTYKKGTKSDIVGSNDIPFYALYETGMSAMGETAKLGAFRVYMTITMKNGEPYIADNSGQAAHARAIPLRVIGEEDENGATIIYDVVEDNLNGNDFIYDLQGRRVSEPKKGGIYIKNGKKILY